MLINVRDENNLSPLDLASSTMFLEGVKLLEDWHKQGTANTDPVTIDNDSHSSTQEIPIEDIRQSDLQKKEYDNGYSPLQLFTTRRLLCRIHSFTLQLVLETKIL